MIAVLPYVTHPKTAVLGRAGGNLMPKEFKSSLPSIDDIEAELEKNSK